LATSGRPVEFPTPVQGTQSPVTLSIYEFGSGHSQRRVTEFQTNDLRQAQAVLLVVLTNPVRFFALLTKQEKHDVLTCTIELAGQMQEGTFKVGVQT
jgi:hypothetical protein